MALTLNSSYQNVGFDYVLDGVRDLLISEFTYGKIYISPELKFNDPFQIKLWMSESSTEDYNAISWSKEYTVDIDLYMIDSNHDENTYKQLHQDTERIYQVLFNNAHKEITVAGNSLQWLNGKTETIGINDFDGEEGEVDGLLKSSLSFTCNVHAGEISNYSTRSLDFDGTNDYLNVANSSALDVGTGDFSISCWVKTNGSVSSAQMLVDRNHVTGYSVYVVSGGALKIAIHGSYLDISGNDIDDSQWHHVVASYDRSGNLNAYLDGALVGTKDISGDTENLNNSSALGIGRSTSSGLYFDGNIDEVALWHTALTQSAITELYNGGKPKDIRIGNFRHLFDSSCKGYWRMGDGTLDEYPLIADQTDATLGSELITDFASWTDAADITTTIDVSTNTVTMESDDSSSTSGTYLSAAGILDAQLALGLYKISFTASWTVAPLIKQFKPYPDGSLDTYNITAGENVYYVNVTNLNNNHHINIYFNNADGDITLANVSCKKVNGNAGLMTNMAAGDIEEDTP